MGTLALALSVGSVVQTSVSYTNVAYATAGDNQVSPVTKESLSQLIADAETFRKSVEYLYANADEQNKYNNAITAASAEITKDSPDEAQFEALQKAITDAKGVIVANLNKNRQDALKALVDQETAVKESAAYKNSLETEQKAYTDAIANAKAELSKASPDANKIQGLIDAINTAKNGLSANTQVTAPLREGLASTIAIAQKLADDTTAIPQADRDALKSLIATATADLNNVASTETILRNSRDNLSNKIAEVLNKNNITDTDKYDLKADDLDKINSGDNAAYGLARKKLADLITTTNNYFDEQKLGEAGQKKIETQLRDDFSNAISQAAEEYDNPASTTKNLTDAYDKLESEYNKVLAAIDANDTLQSRLRAQLKDLTDETIANLDKANLPARNTYKGAIKAGKDVLEKANPAASEAELQTAINNIIRAKSALVDVKTLDDTKTPLERAKAELQEQLNKVAGFKKTDDYLKGPAELKTAYDNAVKLGQDYIAKNESDVTKLQNATADIITKANDLRDYDKKLAELDTLVKEENTIKGSDSYKLASAELQQAYNTAIEAAKILNAKTDKNPEDVINTVNKVNFAKDNLNKASEEKKLKALIDEANNIRNSESYKKAADDKKNAYDNQIKAAEDLLKKNDRTTEQIKNQITAINTAKTGLGIATTLPTNDELTTARDNLARLKNNSDTVRNSDAYRTAGAVKQAKYVKAISEATELLTKYANDNTSVSAKEFTDASKKITDALADIGYEEKVIYHKDLKDLVAEAPEFRKRKEFTDKVNSNNAIEQNIAKVYNKLIEEAEKYIDNGGNDEAYMKNLADAINEAKMAIVGDITITEANLRLLVRQDAQFKNTDAYKNAAKSDKEILKKAQTDYDALIAGARTLLANENRTAIDMQKYVESIENAKVIMNDPSDINLEIYKLAGLIDDGQKVMADPGYADSPQGKKTALKDAMDKAAKINADSKIEDVRRAISDLEAALNVDEYKKILGKSESANLLNLAIKDLAKLARDVSIHPDFKDAPNNQVKALREALEALNKAMTDGDDDALELARVRVVNALLADKIKPITEKVLNGQTGDKVEVEKSKVLDLANKVKLHPDFKELKEDDQEAFNKAIEALDLALKSGDKDAVIKAEDALLNLLNNQTFKPIVNKINADAPVDYKKSIEDVIKADESLKASDKYKKAQSSLKKAYDEALEAAKAVLAKTDATDKDLETAYTNLAKAVDALDGNQFADRLAKLKENFTKAHSSLSDAKRTELDGKIKALESNADATMDDLVTVEKELQNATRLTGNAVPVTTTTTTTTPKPSTTVTPVTTTSQVPATISPGSIVRTGIKSLIGVVAVLAIAVAGYLFVTNQDKKKKHYDAKNKEDKKTRTFEGDIDNENK